MGEIIKDLISRQTCQTLNQLLSSLSSEQAILIDHIKDEILSNISQYAKMADFRTPVKKVEAVFLKNAAHHSQDDQAVLKRALVAKLALYLPHLVEKMDLPSSILALYPDAFERLADFLKSAGDDPYDSAGDFFCKDVRFVLGLSVPCGAQVVDMYSRFRLRTVALSFLRSGDFSAIRRYFLMKGYCPWVQIHTESRYLNDFNEQGWDRCYLRIVELLKRKKDIVGMVGTSWFYDPQLLGISPRIAYLQARPLERGAFLLRHGTQRSDVANAIKISETRRRLYQEGKYIPVCYSVLWPRQDLIAWAKQSRTFPHHD
jgi:hypothetical protein